MRYPYLFLLTFLFCSPAFACDSYEECMGEKKEYFNWSSCYDAQCRQRYDCPACKDQCAALAPCPECSEYSYYNEEKRYDKAIAYKLDEISKKLGPDPEELAKVIDLVHKEGGKVHGVDK